MTLNLPDDEPMRGHIVIGAAEPATEAGRLWHEEWHAMQPDEHRECGEMGCGFLGRILAVEAEAVAALVHRDLAQVEAIETVTGVLDGGEPFDSGYVDKAAVLAVIREAAPSAEDSAQQREDLGARILARVAAKVPPDEDPDAWYLTAALVIDIVEKEVALATIRAGRET